MRSNYFMTFIKGIVFVQVFVIAIAVGLTVDIGENNWKYIKGHQIGDLMVALGPELSFDNTVMIIRETNFMMGVKLSDQSKDQSILSGIDPYNMMGEHIQALAFASPVPALNDNQNNKEEIQLPAVIGEDFDNNNSFLADENNRNYEFFKEHKVYFYCTHSAESYIPNSGKAKLEGGRGLVNTVAQSLADACGKRGLNSVFIDTIHDFPEYNKSYTKSRETVTAICEKNPDLIGLFDIHRDSIPGAKSPPRVTINGKSSAQILIIVGSDERKPHPHWQKNYAFAYELFKQAEKQYPGLIKGVRKHAGTYNQEFNSHALLLEFGSDYNTVEEAKYAAQLFSEVLIEVLKGEIKPL